MRWLVAVLLLLTGCAPAPADQGLPAHGFPKTARWQWQLTGELDLTVDAGVYELDAFTTPASAVTELHKAGRSVICYVNAGAHEDFRPDARRVPDEVIGESNGWSGERWLDVRRWDVLGPALTDRFTLCRDKGFDAVEADNVDGYANRTGFPLTPQDQITFNRRLSGLAHGLGLAIGLKNDLGQVETLEPDFDFAVNEECFRHDECELLEPFLAAGKAVYHVEYELEPAAFCDRARAFGFTSMRKRPALDAWRAPCA